MLWKCFDNYCDPACQCAVVSAYDNDTMRLNYGNEII